MRTVAEIAKELNISRQAVMGWLKKPELQAHVNKKGKTLHVTDAGFAALKGMRVQPKSNNDDKQRASDDNELHIRLLEDRLTDMQNHLKSKESEVQRITDELTNKSKEVADLHRMLENQQILTLNAQAEVKRLSQPQEQEPIVAQQEEQKGFWQRIFSKV